MAGSMQRPLPTHSPPSACRNANAESSRTATAPMLAVPTASALPDCGRSFSKAAWCSDDRSLHPQPATALRDRCGCLLQARPVPKAKARICQNATAPMPDLGSLRSGSRNLPVIHFSATGARGQSALSTLSITPSAGSANILRAKESNSARELIAQ